MIRWLVAMMLCFFACGYVTGAYAGYAQLVPPAPLVLQSGGTTTIAVSQSANAARFAGGYLMTEATLTLGARQVVVPVALRVAANASVFAVTKLNPYVAAASLAFTAWQLAEEWFGRDSETPALQVDASGHIYLPGSTRPPEFGEYQYVNPSTGLNQSVTTLSGIRWNCNGIMNSQGEMLQQGETSFTMGNACGYEVQGVMRYGTTGLFRCSTGWVYAGDYGGSSQLVNGICLLNGAPPPTTTVDGPPPQSRLDSLADDAISASLLPFLSPDIPVDPIPVINPATQPVGDPLIGPNVNPAPVINPQPFRVPNGDPVLIPGTDPPQYNQPWWEITPAPTAEDPWRVQVEQVTTVVTSPNPIIQPVPVPVPSDCDKFPGALGCADVEEPDSQEQIPREDRHIELQQGGSFGGGACPDDLVINVRGTAIQVTDSSTACGWIALARPVIILLAALSALTIIRPGGGKVHPGTSDD